MRAYSSMKTDEFITRLRDAAIASKAPPLVIDQIDQLCGPDAREEEIEELSTELGDAQHDPKDLREALDGLLNMGRGPNWITIEEIRDELSVDNTELDISDIRAFSAAIVEARNALERTKE